MNSQFKWAKRIFEKAHNKREKTTNASNHYSKKPLKLYSKPLTYDSE